MGNNIYVNGTYIKNNPQYHIEDSPWKAQQILKMIRKHRLAISSICEIGCGAGEILRQLQIEMPMGIQFYGYEISPQVFNLCKQRGNDGLHFFNQDMISSVTPSFDLLLCIDVLEHIEDYFGFLKIISKKATYKIFHIPLEMTALFIIRNKSIIQQREIAGHLHYFMKETALSTLIDTGYKILDYFYTPSGLHRTSTVKSKIIKIPRVAISLLNQDLSVRLFGGYSLLVLAK